MSTPKQDVRQAVGELIIGGFHGETVSPAFEGLLRSGHIGGAILFKRNICSIEQTRGLVEALRRVQPRVWMAIDQEGGRVQRLGPPFPQIPPMRVIAARADRARAVEDAARTLATGLRWLGFDQDYAPVLDVDTNPDNPVIGDRSFSDDPEVVSELSCLFIEAMQRAGTAACGKHFPGHGDTNKDSHFELPRLEHDMARLRRVELAPFEAAARVGVASIMTAHVVFAAIDDEHPATLSERVITPLLRDEIGYDGVIVSDDLEMKAVADNYGIGDAAVRAIRAGCDQLLICHETDLQSEAYDALVVAVESGALATSRVLEAADRVAKMKARYQPIGARLEHLGRSWEGEAT